MTTRIQTTLTTVTLLVSAVGTLHADEKSDLLARQKSAAEEKWKKLAFEKPAPPIQTTNFLLFARLPDAKARTLAYALDKQYVTALKALKYEGQDRPWQGKLAIFVFSER